MNRSLLTDWQYLLAVTTVAAGLILIGLGVCIWISA